MAKVYIPSLLQRLTGGKSEVEIEGSTVRQIIDNLEKAHPGLKERLLDGTQLRPNISVAIDGEISPLGTLETVGESSEVHFVAAIRGGKTPRSRGLGLDRPAVYGWHRTMRCGTAGSGDRYRNVWLALKGRPK